VLMSDALAIVHQVQQIPCHWYTRYAHQYGEPGTLWRGICAPR
jgi:hypothetical protein